MRQPALEPAPGTTGRGEPGAAGHSVICLMTGKSRQLLGLLAWQQDEQPGRLRRLFS
jgi:hypothetical protein